MGRRSGFPLASVGHTMSNICSCGFSVVRQSTLKNGWNNLWFQNNYDLQKWWREVVYVPKISGGWLSLCTKRYGSMHALIQSAHALDMYQDIWNQIQSKQSCYNSHVLLLHIHDYNKNCDIIAMPVSIISAFRHGNKLNLFFSGNIEEIHVDCFCSFTFIYSY